MGRQFCSSVWDALTHQLGVKIRYHATSSPPVQQGSGLIPILPKGHVADAAGRLRLGRAPSLGPPRAANGPQRGRGHFSGRASVRASLLPNRPVSLFHQATVHFLHLPAVFIHFCSLRSRPFRLLFNYVSCSQPPSCTSVAASVAEFVARLPRAISGESTQRQVFHHRHWQQTQGGVCGKPQTSPRVNPSFSCSGPSSQLAAPSSRPARPLVAAGRPSGSSQSSVFSLFTPVSRLGVGGTVEAANVATSTQKSARSPSKSMISFHRFGTKYSQS
jgi:hypothetical protein